MSLFGAVGSGLGMASKVCGGSKAGKGLDIASGILGGGKGGSDPISGLLGGQKGGKKASKKPNIMELISKIMEMGTQGAQGGLNLKG